MFLRVLSLSDSSIGKRSLSALELRSSTRVCHSSSVSCCFLVGVGFASKLLFASLFLGVEGGVETATSSRNVVVCVTAG